MCLLALAWGSTFFWIRLALDAGLSPGLVTWGRCLTAAAILVPLNWPRWRQRGAPGPKVADLLLAAMLCNALPFTLVSIGQRTVSVGLAGILNATTPLWAAVLSSALGMRSPRSHLVGVATGFTGVVLVLAPWEATGRVGADAALVAAAAGCYAVAFVFMARRLVPSGATPGELAATQMLSAAALSALLLPAYSWDDAVVTGAGIMAVVALGTISTAFTFWITYRMLAAEGPTNTAVVGYLLPVVSVVLGQLFLAERLTLHATVGTVVILLGVALTRRAPRGGS